MTNNTARAANLLETPGLLCPRETIVQRLVDGGRIIFDIRATSPAAVAPRPASARAASLHQGVVPRACHLAAATAIRPEASTRICSAMPPPPRSRSRIPSMSGSRRPARPRHPAYHRAVLQPGPHARRGTSVSEAPARSAPHSSLIDRVEATTWKGGTWAGSLSLLQVLARPARRRCSGITAAPMISPGLGAAAHWADRATTPATATVAAAVATRRIAAGRAAQLRRLRLRRRDHGLGSAARSCGIDS